MQAQATVNAQYTFIHFLLGKMTFSLYQLFVDLYKSRVRPLLIDLSTIYRNYPPSDLKHTMIIFGDSSGQLILKPLQTQLIV